MEPLLALSLACNITQVIEQSIAVGKLTWQIYNKGSIDSNDEIEKSTKALKNLVIDLELSGRSSGKSNLTLAEQQLLEIAPECSAIANALLDELKTLKRQAKSGKLHAFVLTTRVIWKRGKIEDYVRRLDGHRKALETGILFSLRDQINNRTTKQDLHFDNLNATLAKFWHDLNNDRVWFSEELKNVRVLLDSGLRRIENRLDEQILRQDKERFLTSLTFPEMKQRIRQLAEQPKDEDSCDWIFEDRLAGGWSGYKQWLKDDRQTYWIHGKAGSGKSTLMKSIWDSTKLYDLLHQTYQCDIHVLRHSFLLHGSDLQRSCRGMVCSLLHALLSKNGFIAEMLLICYPHLKENHTIDDWHYTDMQKIWRETLQEVTASAVVCLFLDGMDEIEPSNRQEDRRKILQFLSDMSYNEKVKVCISSRYESPWTNYFRNYPQLQVQDLTKRSIERYVTRRIHMTAPNFSQLDRNSRDENDLISDIVKKANGVFLWVTLAVTAILDMEYMADWNDVKQKVRELPDDLVNLYDEMLRRRSRDSEKVKDEAATYLRLCLEGAALGRKRPTRDLYLHHCLVIRSMFRSSSKALNYDRDWNDFKIDYIEVQQRILNICAGMITFQRLGYLANANLDIESLEPQDLDISGCSLMIPAQIDWPGPNDVLLALSDGYDWDDYPDDLYEDQRSLPETERPLTREDLFEDDEPYKTRSVRLQFSHRSVVDFFRDHPSGSSFLARCRMRDLDILKMSVEADLLRYRLRLRALKPVGLYDITNLALCYQRDHPQDVMLDDVADIVLRMADVVMGLLLSNALVARVSLQTVGVIAFFLQHTTYFEERITPYLRRNKSNNMVLCARYRDLLLLCAVLSDQPSIGLALVDDGANLGAPFYLPWKVCGASVLFQTGRSNIISLEAWKPVIQRKDHSPCQVMIQDWNSVRQIPTLNPSSVYSPQITLFVIDAIRQLQLLLRDDQAQNWHGIGITGTSDHVLSIFPFRHQRSQGYFLQSINHESDAADASAGTGEDDEASRTTRAAPGEQRRETLKQKSWENIVQHSEQHGLCNRQPNANGEPFPCFEYVTQDLSIDQTI